MCRKGFGAIPVTCPVPGIFSQTPLLPVSSLCRAIVLWSIPPQMHKPVSAFPPHPIAASAVEPEALLPLFSFRSILFDSRWFFRAAPGDLFLKDKSLPYDTLRFFSRSPRPYARCPALPDPSFEKSDSRTSRPSPDHGAVSPVKNLAFAVESSSLRSIMPLDDFARLSLFPS